MGYSNCRDDFKDIDYEEVYNIKICSKCGTIMKPMGEKYNFDDPYEDTWWECFECGCCVDR